MLTFFRDGKQNFNVLTPPTRSTSDFKCKRRRQKMKASLLQKDEDLVLCKRTRMDETKGKMDKNLTPLWSRGVTSI